MVYIYEISMVDKLFYLVMYGRLEHNICTIPSNSNVSLQIYYVYQLQVLQITVIFGNISLIVVLCRFLSLSHIQFGVVENTRQRKTFSVINVNKSNKMKNVVKCSLLNRLSQIFFLIDNLCLFTSSSLHRPIIDHH